MVLASALLHTHNIRLTSVKHVHTTHAWSPGYERERDGATTIASNHKRKWFMQQIYSTAQNVNTPYTYSLIHHNHSKHHGSNAKQIVRVIVCATHNV